MESHCKIAGCNAHIDRYLRFSSRDLKIKEAKEMEKLLHQLLSDIKIMNFDIAKYKYLKICSSF
ncbi:MAG: hypothetical protein LBF97_05695 [Elusimicrobiota bacterium]|jgi:hypothetical protein|nr:hypothetical protein [Elusimicrobiota bacterium]